jgi:hypothetical protein
VLFCAPTSLKKTGVLSRRSVWEWEARNGVRGVLSGSGHVVVLVLRVGRSRSRRAD